MTPHPCSQDECPRPSHALGLCKVHYERQRVHGRLHLLTPIDRFADKVEVGLCWEWRAHRTPDGYGRFQDAGKFWLAHRWIYAYVFGELPDHLSVDHLCRNVGCVNPEHLEAVPIAENVLRGYSPEARNARKTHCPQGHPYSGDNLKFTSRGGRLCLTCKRTRERGRKRVRRT